MADMFAMTDSFSQLPDKATALIKLEETFLHIEEFGGQFAILLFCFNDLRLYNEISLKTGDEALRLMVGIFKDHVRESDFLAYWRTMDEFILIMPLTSRSEALKVGALINGSVEKASLNWKFGLYMSGGIALYPDHGRTVHDLINSAEAALKEGIKWERIILHQV